MDYVFNSPVLLSYCILAELLRETERSLSISEKSQHFLKKNCSLKLCVSICTWLRLNVVLEKDGEDQLDR
jgi:hypothetical protein